MSALQRRRAASLRPRTALHGVLEVVCCGARKTQLEGEGMRGTSLVTHFQVGVLDAIDRLDGRAQ